MSLIIALLISSFSGKQPVWYADFNEAKKKASLNHKLMLVNFSGSDWCDACSAWAQQVFGTSAFKTIAAKDLLLINANYPLSGKLIPYHLQKQYNELIKKYNANLQFPFTVLLDENGNKLAEWELSQMFTPDKFINDINRTVSSYSITWQQVKQ